jgi:LacI family transcriptional regulator
MAHTPPIRVTQHDIAAKLGIGQKTVSRVFTNPELVSDALRSRVVGIARELGYRPNTGARAMRTGRFETVVLVQSTERTASPMPEMLVIGMDEVLSGADVSLVFARLPDDQLVSDEFVPKVVRELLADGLLINYDTNIPRRLVELIHDNQLPAVWLNTRHVTATVRPDDLAAGDAATQALIDRGHRRILYADGFIDNGPWVHYSRKDRLAGYRAAMTRAGLPHHEALPDHSINRMAWAGAMLERHLPTAVIGYGGDYEISPFLCAALRLGWSIPDQLSLVSFGPAPYFCGFDIATWLVPQLDMGRHAARQLLATMRDRSLVPQEVVLPYTMHPGATLAMAPKS